MNLSSFFANLHFVTPDLARCAQPFVFAQWRSMLKKHRFGTVINLRGENPQAYWYRDELRACQEARCSHVDLVLSSKRLPSRESLLKLLDLFDTSVKPILIKCSGGADRTGLCSGLYLLHRQGLSAMPAAHGHLRLFPYLHHAKPQQRWIRELLYYFEATHDGLSLRNWLEDKYSDNAFSQHLVAQGKGDFWRSEWK